MSVVFILLEGLTAKALSTARTRGGLPALDALETTGRLMPLDFSPCDARKAMLVSAMTGVLPNFHRILTARTEDYPAQTLRPVRTADRAAAAFWERLDAHEVSCLSVGWPLSITGRTRNSAVISAPFGLTPSRDFQPDLATMVHPPALLESRIGDCWFRPEEFDGEILGVLAPKWRTVNQTVDCRLAALASILAENVSRHAAFLELLKNQPWDLASLCLSLPGELVSLERASAFLADDLFTGLWARGVTLLNAFLVEIFRRIPADAQVVIAGLPHAETPGERGFVWIEGVDSKAPAPFETADVCELAHLLYALCGFSEDNAPHPGLPSLVAPQHPLSTFGRPWQPHPDHVPALNKPFPVADDNLSKTTAEYLHSGQSILPWSDATGLKALPHEAQDFSPVGA